VSHGSWLASIPVQREPMPAKRTAFRSNNSSRTRPSENRRHSICTRTFKRRRYAACLLTRFGSWIEATEPLPSVLVVRLAHTARDRADMHVPEIDVPAVGAFGISAAGGFGHALFEARPVRVGKLSIPWGSERRGLQRVVGVDSCAA
jgi:hypothetical protein